MDNFFQKVIWLALRQLGLVAQVNEVVVWKVLSHDYDLSVVQVRERCAEVLREPEWCVPLPLVQAVLDQMVAAGTARRGQALVEGEGFPQESICLVYRRAGNRQPSPAQSWPSFPSPLYGAQRSFFI